MNKCRKCGIKINNYELVNGRKRNLSKRKFCLKCSPFGKHNTRDLRIKIFKDGKKFCPSCKMFLDLNSFYKRDNILRSYCKRCCIKRVNDRIKDTKRKAIAYLGGKCIRCGYSKCIAALDFHHKKSSEKEKDINHMKSLSFNKLKKELDKCELYCSNCHRELHSSSHQIGL
jgi:hypothetical protein